MYFINTNFALVKPVGGLSESRIKSLKDYFGKVFPETLQPDEQTVIFKRGVTAFIITPEQLLYATQGEETDINLQEITNYLDQANEILGLSENSNVIIRLEAIADSEVNTLTKSNTHLSGYADELNATGIGFRFMINHDEFHGDINIEPYLKDPKKIFINTVLDSNSQESLTNLEQVLNKMYSFGTRNAKDVAKRIFS